MEGHWPVRVSASSDVLALVASGMCFALACVHYTRTDTTNTQHSDTGIPELITTKEVTSDAYSACQVLFSYRPCHTQKRT